MRALIAIGFILLVVSCFGQPGTITEHLKVDQFGYPETVEKICVINNPTSGFDFNAGDFYTPGSTLQIRNATNHALLFSGPATSWHSGSSYAQSGDQIWWFNFSTVTTPGTYYVYDPVNDKRSFTFEISDNVYIEVLKQSVRMFYYQRSGYAKTAQNSYDWTDGASNLGTQQVLFCRLIKNPVAGTSKQ
jgi:hypothetical protein